MLIFLFFCISQQILIQDDDISTGEFDVSLNNNNLLSPINDSIDFPSPQKDSEKSNKSKNIKSNTNSEETQLTELL